MSDPSSETGGRPLASNIQQTEGTTRPPSIRKRHQSFQSLDEHVVGTKSSSSQRHPASRNEATFGPHTGSTGGNSSTMQRSTSPTQMSPVVTVNYTRTGRISKSKKGLKVYNCECGRAYTRAEHLRRHQKNHNRDALVCEFPDCGKTFFRLDLLQRHQERHNETEGDSQRPSFISQGTTAESEPPVSAPVTLPSQIVTTVTQVSPYYQQAFSPIPESTPDLSTIKSQRSYPSRSQIAVTIPVGADGLQTGISWHDPFSQSPTYSSSGVYVSLVDGADDYANIFAHPPYTPVRVTAEEPEMEEYTQGPCESTSPRRPRLDEPFQMLPPSLISQQPYTNQQTFAYPRPPPSPQSYGQGDVSHPQGLTTPYSTSSGQVHGPCTDSGYASTQHNKQHVVPADVLRYEEDRATVYTQESDLNSTARDSYISEFARLLFDGLHGKQAVVGTTEKVYDSLEELLRSFALRLAHSSPEQEVLRLGAFIHRHRRNIAENFKNLGLASCDSPVSSPRATGGMSYLDKVGAWAISNLDEMEAPAVPEGLDNNNGSNFGEIDDEEEHLPEILIYRRLIEDSGAYMWLLAQLRRKSMLSSPGLDIKGAIRKDILGVLPGTPRISRTRPPELIRAVYNVQWDLHGFLKGQQYKEEPEHALENAITLTGSVEETQAETCIGYLEQTWPVMGECLVRVLKRAIQSVERVRHTSNAVDGTVLTAWVQSRKIIVTALGSIDSIADIGEQLAWLGSSLRQSPVHQGPVFCFAETHEVGAHKLHSNTPSGPSIELHCTIGFRIARPEDQKQPCIMNGKCWHNLFRNPVIAMGFPIPIRDEPQAGLEIPLFMMATLAQAKRVTLFDGKFFAKGYSTVLFPTKRLGNTVLWHLLYNENGQRLPYTDPRIDQLQDSSVGSIGMAEISHSRHVLGWASSAEIVPGAVDANYNIRRSGYNSGGPGYVLEKVSLSAGKVINVGANLAIGVREVPLHLKREGSYVDQIQDAYNNYVILYDVDEKRAWMVNGATALLHIVRASLHDTLTGKFKSHSIFKPEDLKEAAVQHTSDSAIDVLTCRSNMELEIARDKDEIWTETTKSEDGSEHRVTKRKEKSVYFQDIVDQKWHILEQILDQQSKKITNGVKMGIPGRQYLEGFDFTDVATRIQDLHPKATVLQARGKAWVDFTRSVSAITLFGRGFGELIRPAKESNKLCPH
ncbi:hypothetical protein K469DRAFT_687236 [Zopfia rhizophila CBS 207.26]|uniref:C2H2-type domain-containing protein n=1 Tax=Zopfia rhizophila CBS 207.26 TaxID=1314779 RepID=A0A6A6E651_9PEZI|nr:hypothetical protein K469DRAFT_687236 [Zopfia rhizophila CBS 207.26]